MIKVIIKPDTRVIPPILWSPDVYRNKEFTICSLKEMNIEGQAIVEDGDPPLSHVTNIEINLNDRTIGWNRGLSKFEEFTTNLVLRFDVNLAIDSDSVYLAVISIDL